MIDRRMMLGMMLSALPVAACARPAKADVLTVYKSPTCGCCGAWVKHIQASGLQVRVFETELVGAKAKELGVPDKFRSCHTAEIGGYFIEGHVPADDIRRLLRERPKALGLSVPGMPIGSPGMEQGGRRETFNTVIVDRTGAARIFHRHNLQAAR